MLLLHAGLNNLSYNIVVINVPLPGEWVTHIRCVMAITKSSHVIYKSTQIVLCFEAQLPVDEIFVYNKARHVKVVDGKVHD